MSVINQRKNYERDEKLECFEWQTEKCNQDIKLECLAKHTAKRFPFSYSLNINTQVENGQEVFVPQGERPAAFIINILQLEKNDRN